MTGKKDFLPNSLSVQAVTDKRHQWESLGRDTSEGYWSFDNNLAERKVKIGAMGRREDLVVASAIGGRRAAIHDSLVSNASSIGLEPYA
jgi:hypothetical protein